MADEAADMLEIPVAVARNGEEQLRCPIADSATATQPRLARKNARLSRSA